MMYENTLRLIAVSLLCTQIVLYDIQTDLSGIGCPVKVIIKQITSMECSYDTPGGEIWVAVEDFFSDDQQLGWISLRQTLQSSDSVEIRMVCGPNNPGMELDLAWIQQVRVNLPAVKRRADTLTTKRTVKQQWQAGWLLRAVTCIDLTTLAGDDTPSNTARLALKAAKPIRPDLIKAMDAEGLNITCGAVCVYPSRVKETVQFLNKYGASQIPVAAVATGFPSGQYSLDTRLQEIKMAVAAGAREIDIVINRTLALQHNWEELYNEVVEMKKACGDAHMKSILAIGELATMENVYKASLVCMMAGSDFIKTSTGKEGVNATLPVGLVMCRAIREYFEKTGFIVGFKPAGGIRTAKDAMAWLILIKEELGDDWLNNQLFRIGASGLLTDIERQLFHWVTGRYAAAHELAMS